MTDKKKLTTKKILQRKKILTNEILTDEILTDKKNFDEKKLDDENNFKRQHDVLDTFKACLRWHLNMVKTQISPLPFCQNRNSWSNRPLDRWTVELTLQCMVFWLYDESATNKQLDRWTDGPIPSYRDARSHLKINKVR